MVVKMFKVYKNIGWFFKQEWKTYCIMLILLLLLSSMTLIPAKLIGNVIDLISQGSITKSSLLWTVVILIATPIVRYVFDFWYHYLINAEGQKLSYQLRKRYLNKLFEMDAKLYEEYTKGELISRITNDLKSITVAATTLLQEMVYQGSLLLFSVGMMVMTIHVKLTLASVILMPISVFLLTKVINRMRRYYKIHRGIYSEMTEKILESIEGVRVVRANVQELTDLANLETTILNDIRSWKKIVRFETVFGPLFDFIYSVCYFIAFAYGTYLVINQEITIGQLVTFTMYLGILYSPIVNLSNIFNQVNNAIISSDRFNEILEKDTEVKDTAESKDLIDFSEIEFKDVSFKYPFDKHHVINNIHFTIKKGETIGIVGPTGSGKSTLIRQLLREFNVTTGQVLIDGVSIEEYKIEHVRQLVGYVPQSHILFRRSVDENILIGQPDADEQKIQDAMVFADFTKDLSYLPKGLDTLVGEQGQSLSGGQKQRLSIARAVVKDPQILILDDSLSAVDANTEEIIIGHLKEDRKGKTNIIVAHRFSAVKEADQIIVLMEGKITEKGTHNDLMLHKGWYYEQYQKQSNMGKLEEQI
jgi:ATP-binding cassette subfamily B protein